MKIILAGTPEFAVPSLKRLIESEHQVIAVYTQPDRPAGRGQQKKASPVKQIALKAGIPVYQPDHFKNTAQIDWLKALNPDLMVVVAYGLLLPPAVLEVPRLGCINIHASLLPRWRGAAPIQRAIQAGDRQTGISIMRMEAGLDTGPVFLTRSLPIQPEDTGGSLHDKLSQLGAEALLDALPGIENNQLVPQPQDESKATYAHKLTKSEAWIDWHRPAIEIERQIRAFNPWPVARTQYQERYLRIWQARARPETTGLPGQVRQNKNLIVSTGQGDLEIIQLQWPGKKKLYVADFINAYDLNGVFLSD